MPTYESIYAVVKRIKKGEVMSYGEVAARAGMPRGARLVGWALAALPPETDVPWQRVVNREDYLTIVNAAISKDMQKRLLEAEGWQLEMKNGMWKLVRNR